MNKEKIEQYWKNFLMETGRDLNTSYYEAFHFELSEDVSNELLDLVLAGVKKATASSLASYQRTNEPIPKVNDYSIVTDWSGEPRCIIQTTNVSIIPFKDITYNICKREGEDDCLESWQRGHIKFFKAEGKELGYEFNWDMPVVFEDFKVVYK